MVAGHVGVLEAGLPSGAGPLVHLLGVPTAILEGIPRHLTDGHARLLGYLAFNRDGHDRRYVARTLWPDAGEERAEGNLRAAIWRLHRDNLELVKSDGHMLSLRESVIVDVRLLDDWAARLIAGTPLATDLAWIPRSIDTEAVLPWLSEDWIDLERQRLQQRMLLAIECLSRELRLAGRLAEALESALVGCRADPLRESAQATAIEAHLSAGNFLLAQHRYQQYRDRVLEELGVEPSPELAHRLASRIRGKNP